MSAELSFTGERMVPGKVDPDLFFEHATRYQFASGFVSSRRVLDAGCGAGYGSAILAETARSVVGVDLSPDAVAYACKNYPLAKIKWMVGSCEELPFADGSFDAVVAFEVIEHLADPLKLLREAARVLSDKGFLIVSTPNRKRYKDARPGYVNPFHTREFYLDDWTQTLGTVFPCVAQVGQGYVQCITFSSNGSQALPSVRQAYEYADAKEENGVATAESEFFVAICAKIPSALPRVDPRIYLLSESNQLPEKERYIAALRDQLHDKETDLVKAGELLRKLNSDLIERTQWARQLDGEKHMREQQVKQLNMQLTAKTQEASAASSEAWELKALVEKQIETGYQQVARVESRLTDLAEAHRAELAALRSEFSSAIQSISTGLLRIEQNLADQTRSLQRSMAQCSEQVLDCSDALDQFDINLRSDRTERSEDYRRVVSNIRASVRKLTRRGATMAVISKGDAAIVELPGRHGEHFPKDSQGRYQGFHPACSAGAIVQLEAHRADGAEYLVIPETAMWWLDHYADFAAHLDRHYPRLAGTKACSIYDLRTCTDSNARASVDESSSWQTVLRTVITQAREHLGRPPAVLDWRNELELPSKFPGETVFSNLEKSTDLLPYLDNTVDLVVLPKSLGGRSLEEAHRVATVAVVSVSPTRSLTVDWLVEPSRSERTVSIIIPCHNVVEHTSRCLKAIAETLPKNFGGEVLVVDDASTDQTPDVLAEWALRDARFRSIRLDVNGGFIDACNRGAAAASGAILVFLNNDTLPQHGWLEPLLSTLANCPNAGAVGGKLVYPDGRLQEAGGVIFNDASGANFGRGDRHLDAPLFNYLRPVDYCSGALLATRKATFISLGGFDSLYRPAYYEDVDYCFRLREIGLRTYYQPLSCIIHCEGASCGTDTTAGVKRHQVVNRETFKQRWANVLTTQPHPVDFSRTDAWLRLLAQKAGRDQEGLS